MTSATRSCRPCIRLQAAEVYVGESATISADEQARLLGEAWERASTPDLHIRLVVFHRSGRSDIYHLGPHAPELNVRDYDLIHRIWRDAAKSVGPHLHHHDVVRAALTTMAEQLSGPNRDEALQAIRAVVRPADELAAVLRSRDYPRLRDMVRNRPPSELGALLADLSLDDQAVVFRLLPRKDAAATFEYLEQDAREALLKTLSKEDVASLLNEMAPDDRTMFLEELPATATRELLALLTPQERADRGDAARLSREVGRPVDDAGLHRRPGGLDDSAGARLRARARTGQRNPERPLRRRRPTAC